MPVANLSTKDRRPRSTYRITADGKPAGTVEAVNAALALREVADTVDWTERLEVTGGNHERAMRRQSA